MDKAGTSPPRTAPRRPAPPQFTWTCNDPGQLTAQNGSTTGWSYDKTRNETAGGRTAASARTNETWTDCSQLSGTTVGGMNRVHDDERRGHRIHPRTRGHVEFHDRPTGLPCGTTTEAVPHPLRYTGAYRDH